MDCDVQYGGCSLLVHWVYSLFLVTAVKKLPSSGALWHAAWKEGCVGRMLLRTFSYVSFTEDLPHITLLSTRWLINCVAVLLVLFCKMIHLDMFCRCICVEQWQLSSVRSTEASGWLIFNLRRGDKWSVLTCQNSYDCILVLFSPLLLSGFGSTRQL